MRNAIVGRGIATDCGSTSESEAGNGREEGEKSGAGAETGSGSEAGEVGAGTE